MGSTLCGVSYHLSLDLDIVTFDTTDALSLDTHRASLQRATRIVLTQRTLDRASLQRATRDRGRDDDRQERPWRG